MPNADELNATMADIRENPHLWDQDDYFTVTECGTTACFIGLHSLPFPGLVAQKILD